MSRLERDPAPFAGVNAHGYFFTQRFSSAGRTETTDFQWIPRQREIKNHCSTDSSEADIFKKRFTQDPDVPDTWFSSGCGLCDDGLDGRQNPRLQQPNTPSFLSHDRSRHRSDIIFFGSRHDHGRPRAWARCLSECLFHRIILRKLDAKVEVARHSDPLDLIGQHGADALRWDHAVGPTRQDLLFDELQVELGRNLQQALNAPIRQMGGADSPIEGETNRAFTSDDKWILLRLDRAIQKSQPR
jgi:valyl-tRNA synthetase